MIKQRVFCLVLHNERGVFIIRMHIKASHVYVRCVLYSQTYLWSIKSVAQDRFLPEAERSCITVHHGPSLFTSSHLGGSPARRGEVTQQRTVKFQNFLAHQHSSGHYLTLLPRLGADKPNLIFNWYFLLVNNRCTRLDNMYLRFLIIDKCANINYTHHYYNCGGIFSKEISHNVNI